MVMLHVLLFQLSHCRLAKLVRNLIPYKAKDGSFHHVSIMKELPSG